MIEIIIEALVGSLAENLSGKAFGSVSKKRPKLFGWLALIILAIVIVGLVILGIVLFHTGTWPLGVLMLLIAAFVLYITATSIVKGIKNRKAQRP